MQPDLVILDLDGTIIDHRGAVRQALEVWLPSLGQVGDEQLFDAWIAAENRHYPAWRSREISFAEQRRRRLRDFLPLIGQPVGDEGDLDVLFEGYLSAYAASWAAYPDAEPALDELAESGVRLAVLTNGTDEQQNAKLSAVGLRGKTGPVFSSEELGVAKPGHRSYLEVCARMQVAPARTVHVGDLYDLDVVAPREAGLQAIHLDRYNAGPLTEPLRVSSLAQVPGMIAGL
jgi:putative hydrolase of the HAD superfamily